MREGERSQQIVLVVGIDHRLRRLLDAAVEPVADQPDDRLWPAWAVDKEYLPPQYLGRAEEAAGERLVHNHRRLGARAVAEVKIAARDQLQAKGLDEARPHEVAADCVVERS